MRYYICNSEIWDIVYVVVRYEILPRCSSEVWDIVVECTLGCPKKLKIENSGQIMGEVIIKSF